MWGENYCIKDCCTPSHQWTCSIGSGFGHYKHGWSKPLYANIATSNAQIKHTCKSNTSVTCSLSMNIRSIRTVLSMFHDVSMFTRLLMVSAYPAFSSLCYSITNDIVAVTDGWEQMHKGIEANGCWWHDQNTRHVHFNNKCDNGQLHAWQMVSKWQINSGYGMTIFKLSHEY